MQALVSLRLALAHLQQEAGPDRRATFRADMMRFSYSSDTANPVAWKDVRNPMWTGVQRTDRPFQLPSWIISGRGDSSLGTNNSQMVSLSLPTGALSTATPYWNSAANPISYPTNYWIPWESYTGGTDSSKIVLVGDATATIAENEGSDPLSGRPDGRVSLPPVSLPDNNVSGRYCYWVGDEGVKANISLIDPRVQTSTATNSSVAIARRGVGRTGVELLTGFSNYQVGDIDSRIRSADQLKLLSSSVFSDSTGNIAKALWPDVTLVSQGLFTDNKWGGLQIDLSTAFEKIYSDFDNSEFGTGDGANESSNGAVTFGFMEGFSGPSITSPVSYGNDWVAFRNWKKTFAYSNNIINVAPVWTVKNPWDIMGFKSSTAAIRGPTWYALRNYHRLYRELASGPQIKARTHFPNAPEFASSSYPSIIGFLHYSQMYNRSVTPRIFTTKYDGTQSPVINNLAQNTPALGNNFLDYIGYDKVYVYGPRGNSYNNTILNNSPAGSFLGPIPTKVSVAPYISRQLVAIGVIKIGNILQLTVSPVTVLHNPYNVQLLVDPQRISIRNLDNWWIQYTRTYASGSLDPYTAQTTDTWTNQEGILSIIKGKNNTKNPNATRFQSLRFDIPKITMEAGEFKVFTADTQNPIYSGTLVNSFNTNNGFYGPCLDNTKTAKAPPQTGFDSTPNELEINNPYTANLSLKLFTNSYMLEGFKIVHEMKDALPTGGATSEAFYNTSNIITELTSSLGRSNYTGLASQIVGNEPSVPSGFNFNIPTNIPDKGSTPYMLGVFDYSIRWANDPSPFTLFVRSNPLAASRRVDARDSTWYHINSSGNTDTFPPGPYFSGTQFYSSTSPSFKLEVRDIRRLDSSVVDTTPGGNAYGGMSNWSANGGVTRAVFTEVPLSAPLSIAQYTHANFGIYDHEPLFLIGNGLAPAFSKNSTSLHYIETLSSAMNTDPPTSSNETTYADPAMMINRALFDRYFLSSIGPVFSNGNEIKSMADGPPNVIDDFIDGISPLANPRIKLVTTNKETARTELKDQKKNHRKVAKHIVNEGAFNIHSMSVRAWAAILAGAKARALSNESGDLSSNARFPRAVRGDNVSASGVNQAPYNTNAAWTGLTNLTDNQLSILAREIVKENLWRMSYYHRDASIGLTGDPLSHRMHGTGTGVTIRDLPAGSANTPPGKLPCPYLGLSQFINRNLCPHLGGGIRYRCGALQSAIIAADVAGAKLSNRSSDGSPDTILNHVGNTYKFSDSLPPSAPPNTNTNYLVPPPSVRQGTGITPTVNGTANQIILPLGTVAPSYTSTNYADVKLGAPTALLQSDILAAIGNSLTIRSDTFTIRAYGDVSDKAGSPAAGACWIEAVVQRLPDFIDPSQDADFAVNGNDAPSPYTSALGHNPNLLPVNINLGRRFVIVSMRILKPNEL